MNNVRYKTARLLKKTSMYRSRYVYNRHYLPRAVCLTDPPQLTPVSLPQQGPITPCIFFSNTKSVKNSTRDFFKKKNMFQVFFFFLSLPTEPSRLGGKVLENPEGTFHLTQEEKLICPKTPPDEQRDVSVESTTTGKRV